MTRKEEIKDILKEKFVKGKKKVKPKMKPKKKIKAKKKPKKKARAKKQMNDEAYFDSMPG